MTNNEILKADMLDILFGHRNKSYGAYALRRYYNHRLLIARGIALTAVVLFFLISLMNESKKQNSSRMSDDKNVVTLTDLNIEPAKKIVPPPPPERIEPVAQVKDVTIKIVPDELADDIIPDQKGIFENVISNKNVEGTSPGDLNKGFYNASETRTRVKEEKQSQQIIDPIEIQPSFPGGPEALASFFTRTLSSPADLEAGEKKLVLVRFVVGADGSITKAKIIQRGGDSYNREVLRAFKHMPGWNPAIQNGFKVAVSFTQPVTFIGVEQ
jgi:protein TonB